MYKLEVKKNTVRKHTGAIHISNTLTLVERKISNVLLKNAYKQLCTKNQHVIKIIDLVDEIGWENTSKAPSHITNSLNKLNRTQINWNILGKDKKRTWGVSTLLASAEIRDGSIFYSYSSKLKEWFSNPSLYATLNLDMQNKLTSKYSLALWEFATEQLDTNKESNITTEYFSLEQIRELLGTIGETYKDYRYLNVKALKPAIEEVNSKTDLEISIMLHKKNKKVESIALNINRNAMKVSAFNDLDTIKVIEYNITTEDIVNRGTRLLLLEEKFVKKCINRHGSEKVSDAINHILELTKDNQNINNIGAYLSKILQEGLIKKVSTLDLFRLSDSEQKDDKNIKKIEVIESINRMINDTLDETQVAVWEGIRTIITPTAMDVILREKGGIILSKEYINSVNRIVIRDHFRFTGIKRELEGAIIKKLFLLENVEIYFNKINN